MKKIHINNILNDERKCRINNIGIRTVTLALTTQTNNKKDIIANMSLFTMNNVPLPLRKKYVSALDL